MRALALSLALLSGCGTSFDLDQPIRIQLYPLGLGEFFDQTAVTTARGALRQLGATDADGPTVNPLIIIKRGRPEQCQDDVVGRALDGVVYLCEGAIKSPLQWFETIYHEVGHILGAKHLPCETRAIMAPYTGCAGERGVAPDYLPEDIAEICRTTRGGVCAGRTPDLSYPVG